MCFTSLPPAFWKKQADAQYKQFCSKNRHPASRISKNVTWILKLKNVQLGLKKLREKEPDKKKIRVTVAWLSRLLVVPKRGLTHQQTKCKNAEDLPLSCFCPQITAWGHPTPPTHPALPAKVRQHSHLRAHTSHRSCLHKKPAAREDDLACQAEALPHFWTSWFSWWQD